MFRRSVTEDAGWIVREARGSDGLHSRQSQSAQEMRRGGTSGHDAVATVVKSNPEKAHGGTGLGGIRN